MAEAVFSIPDFCPVCAGPSTEDGDFLYCRNKTCPAKLAGCVKVWIRQLGLLNWGDVLIETLTDPDMPRISNVADLYRMSEDELAECSSGPKMGSKLYRSLHGSKTVSLELVLSGLNIPNLGLATASDIVRSGYDSIEKVISMTYDDFLKVPNVGDITARCVHDGIHERRSVLLDLGSVLDIRQPDTGPLTGKSFCITGELSRPRKAVEKMILDAGGMVKSSVTATTSYLVTNYPDTGSSKMKSAKKHLVPVIDEAGLLAILSDVT